MIIEGWLPLLPCVCNLKCHIGLPWVKLCKHFCHYSRTLLQLVTLVPKKSSQPQAELEFQWQPPVSQIHKICPALPSIVLIMTQNLFHHQNGQSLSSKISMGSGRHIRQLIGSFHHHSTSFMSQTPSRNKPAPQSRDRGMKAVAKSDHGSTRDKGKQTQRGFSNRYWAWGCVIAHYGCFEIPSKLWFSWSDTNGHLSQGHIHYLLYLLDLGLFAISGYERMGCCPLCLWYQSQCSFINEIKVASFF